MKHLPTTSQMQQGSTLLEALVALLLTSIIALGGAFAVTKILQSQRQSKAQVQAVGKLRELLQGGATVCDGTARTIDVNGQTLTITATCTDKTVTIGSKSVTVKQPVLSVTNTDLFGGQVTVGE